MAGPPATEPILRRPHRPGCTGSLYRTRPVVHGDRLGRIGNGGTVFHDYRCNTRWNRAGCGARVLVPEAAVRALALSVEFRP